MKREQIENHAACSKVLRAEFNGSGTDKLLLAALAYQSDDSGMATMTIDSLSELTGLDRKTVSACLNRLADSGKIVREGLSSYQVRLEDL